MKYLPLAFLIFAGGCNSIRFPDRSGLPPYVHAEYKTHLYYVSGCDGYEKINEKTGRKYATILGAEDDGYKPAPTCSQDLFDKQKSLEKQDGLGN